jgi:hypothetical protein
MLNSGTAQGGRLQLHVLDSFVFLLLPTHKLFSDFFVVSYGWERIASCLELLAGVGALLPTANTGNKNGALIFDVINYLRHTILGRDIDDHMHMIYLDTTRFYRTFFLSSQLHKRFPQLFADLLR